MSLREEHLITAKKRLNSAQLEVQRALSLENDDHVLVWSMGDAIEKVDEARNILDFIMGAYGMEIEDGTE